MDNAAGARHARLETAIPGVPLNIPTRKNPFSANSPKRGTLSVIIRTFKGAVTTETRKRGLKGTDPIWQRNFHDHVIRDDVEHFFIERYIRLNLIMWTLDSDMTGMHSLPLDDLRELLRREHGLEGYPLEQVIQREVKYRFFRENRERTE